MLSYIVYLYESNDLVYTNPSEIIHNLLLVDKCIQNDGNSIVN